MQNWHFRGCSLPKFHGEAYPQIPQDAAHSKIFSVPPINMIFHQPCSNDIITTIPDVLTSIKIPLLFSAKWAAPEEVSLDNK